MKEYFNFSKSEKRGYLVILSLIILVIILKQLLPNIRNSQKTDFSQFEKEILEFESQDKNIEAKIELKTHRYLQNRRETTPINYYSNKKYKKEVVKPKIISINTADSIQFKELYGIGPVLSKRIVKYRDLLGGFVCKKQLREVYGLSPETYLKIESRIVLDSISVTLLNINSCKINELKKHPYLTYKDARRIVEAKSILGQFARKEELLENSIFDSTLYDKIAVYLTVK